MDKRKKEKILIVEDEQGMNEILRILLESDGYEVSSAMDGEKGIELLKKDIFDLVITDIKMPGVDGFEVLRKAKELSPDTLVIMVTAFGTTESAIEAMKLGAYDYIHKPFKIDEIRIVVNKALEKRGLRRELEVLREEIRTTYRLENIIGKSPRMQGLLNIIPKIAQSSSSVLITGESGSGKELVARAIHNISPRAEKAFVAINCASLPEGLLESELLGYMKGAFTGATHNKEGLFEIAHSGSIFLDEIGEMPVNIQAKILRVIETGTFRRLGGTNDIKVDVRVIAATNKDLKKAIKAGEFREDLFYRLNVVPVRIPPLRERKEDIPPLVEHFLKKFGHGEIRISPESMRVMVNYSWPGNVRELENVIERTVLLTEHDVILPGDLPSELRETEPEEGRLPDLTVNGIDLDRILEDMERSYIKRALELTYGVKTEAAKLLNLSFRSFRHRLHKYGIGPEDDKEG
ncbi:Response regulator of zinc sigma-54-dependent two-component system [hydrothermal vent metagenome]|uniref:Response regulator of zinc sigma-54-dependent two-component system n=1 Tax=hydrothermal vent metagenome TaxID=652676 RepID=A0A3B1D0W8_9ZZZZ